MGEEERRETEKRRENEGLTEVKGKETRGRKRETPHSELNHHDKKRSGAIFCPTQKRSTLTMEGDVSSL